MLPVVLLAVDAANALLILTTAHSIAEDTSTVVCRARVCAISRVRLVVVVQITSIALATTLLFLLPTLADVVLSYMQLQQRKQYLTLSNTKVIVRDDAPALSWGHWSFRQCVWWLLSIVFKIVIHMTVLMFCYLTWNIFTIEQERTLYTATNTTSPSYDRLLRLTNNLYSLVLYSLTIMSLSFLQLCSACFHLNKGSNHS